jgi:hypothetical protein
MNAMTIKVITGCAAIAVGVAAVVDIGHFGSSPAPVEPVVVVAPDVIHTADWYLAHRDVLKVDEQRCVGNASTISPAECQNVREAVSEVDNNNFQNLLQQEKNSNK